MSKKSELEEHMAQQLSVSDVIPEAVRQYRWAKSVKRRYRCDFAWPDHRLLIEVQGAIWSGGAHGRGTGIQHDMAKVNLAQALGLNLLQFGPREVRVGWALWFIENWFKNSEDKAVFSRPTTLVGWNPYV